MHDDRNTKVVIVACFRATGEPDERLELLRRNAIHASASIRSVNRTSFRIRNHPIARMCGAAIGAGIGVLAVILTIGYWPYHSIHSNWTIDQFIAGYPIPTLTCTAIGAVLGYWAFSLVFGVRGRILRRLQEWITPGETFVVVSAGARDTQRVLSLLREDAEDLPGVFVFHGEKLPFTDLPDISEAPHDQTTDRLSSKARNLAEEQRVGGQGKPSRVLLNRLNDCEAAFARVSSNLASSARNEQRIELSAEWLLDNAYIVQGHIDEYRDNLPRNFYRELPILAGGINHGLPRVFEIAQVFVHETQARVTSDDVLSFLLAYQVVTPLTMGELWALPLMLRLALVEYLKELVRHVERRQIERELGDFWASRLLTVGRTDPGLLVAFVSFISRVLPRPSAYLAQELMGNVTDTPDVVVPLRGWLDVALGMPTPDAINHERNVQAVQQLSLVNTMSSLRLLAQTDWTELFERVSIVDLILRTDPAGVYHAMDYKSRDYYRKAVEALSRGSRMPELDIAYAAIKQAERGQSTVERHVGYHLVDAGRIGMERAVRSRPRPRLIFERAMSSHPAASYVLPVLALTVGILAAAIHAASMPFVATVWLLTLLGILPASEIAIQLVNLFLARVFEPRLLPKLAFEHGISDEFKTLVVVPMMLLTPESIGQEIERLQIRALANPDKNLLFALLSDFSDADRQSMPEDDERLEVAKSAIQNIGERFFLFHRNREWSESEQRWMGWERKRGKLEDLNNYLTNHRNDARVANLLLVGDEDALRGVRFVLTLDADTQLPRDTAGKLVATLAHPLNQPKLSPEGRRIERGYAIIQPRVTTSLPSATETVFSRLFTDSTGIDPYAHAISDAYQDLSGEGIYHGKGIYDLAAFRTLLADRFPEQHLLSHDLIEGAHCRVGLATDIELYDTFPSNSYSYMRREHRWIRGDWQIADWIFTRVPTGGRDRVANPLSRLNRWKILDNLRRSLIAPATVALLAISWFCAPKHAAWTLLVALSILVPALLQVLATALSDQRMRMFSNLKPWESFVRAVVWTSMLPSQAANAIDAIARVWYRRRISHRLLLEWETAHQTSVNARVQNLRAVLGMLWIPICSAVALVWLASRASALPPGAIVFLGLWIAAPAIALWLGEPIGKKSLRELSAADHRTLRLIAHRTWRYFDHFVGPGTNWLPPDNYQEDLTVEVAARTSPTNIGMWLLSTIAANDLGYITLTDAVRRAKATFTTLLRLEKYEGHLLNWYATDTCQALHPRYVSMVDSGNLLGALWTLDQSYTDLVERQFADPAVVEGMVDTLTLIQHSPAPAPVIAQLAGVFKAIQRESATTSTSVSGFIIQIRTLYPLTQSLRDLLERDEVRDSEIAYLSNRLLDQVRAWNECIDQFLGWIELLSNLPDRGLLSLGPDAHHWRRQALAANPSLRSIADGHIPGLPALLSMRGQRGLDGNTRDWLDSIAVALERAMSNARQLLSEIEDVRADCRQLADSTNMRFLYVSERHMFAVGYNVDEGRIDNFYYNLLASEARLGSFVSIARGEVPMEHWFSLGRPMGLAYGKRVLMSWSGTMFEYLMPILLTRSFDNSLLDHACQAAVSTQIAYGRKRGVPWGISEAGYSAVDARQIYQYHAFGVPGLGLKRNLEEDLVVAPYASALALAVNPKQAIQNLKRLSEMTRPRQRGTDSLMGSYGFYESIDYSRQRDKEGVRGVIVRCYMAHHQGMSLLAIDNALNDNVMQKRFHSDLRVRSTESLLYERIPTGKVKVLVDTEAPTNLNVIEPALFSSDVHFDTPNTNVPRTHLLSNSEYCIMVTNSGGGYSRWRDFEIVRWRADTTCDNYGSFFYLKDVDSGDVWSNTFHPVDRRPESYRGTFTTEKAEFRARHDGIEVLTEIVVSPEDNAEVRRLTLVNQSPTTRTIEVTSYLELALASHAGDRSHPAFSKLFVETEAISEADALLARRRPRSNDEATPWAGHVVASDKNGNGRFHYETDREKFIGRGRTLRSPAGLDGDLSGGVGPVLDPIFSIRRRIHVKPGERTQIAFVTVAGDSRDAVHRLVTKYSNLHASDRAIELAWTDAQLALRQLRIQSDEAVRYQVLAAKMLYPDSRFRPPDDTLRCCKAPRNRLWAYGISGDLPILVILVRDTSETEVVRQVVRAHAYWRVRGLICDLVIVDQEPSTYNKPLKERLQQIIDSNSDIMVRERPGGVFLRSSSLIAPDDMTLLVSLAHVVLVAARGSLSQQLSIAAPGTVSSPIAQRKAVMDSISAPLPFMDLKFFNGIGGFTQDGREYAIYLGAEMSTPAPWINVMANPSFGAIVSESGSGFCWYGNSQMNRLTPWSNDPILDPAGDAIFIRDDDLGVVWTPTPSPIREHDAYRARHGQGYTVHEHNSHGIEQELTTFVPVNARGGDPLRVQVLRLVNSSGQRRRLTVTPYVEWVLGTTREETQMQVQTEWDSSCSTLLARNPTLEAFSGKIAFLSSGLEASSFTADRGEFIGRNGSLGDPEALRRTRLSNHTGASLDPCGAIQSRVDLEPGQTVEIVFVLGQTESLEEIRRLVKHYCDTGRAREALAETIAWWDSFLGTITVDLPDEGANFLINRWLLYQDLSCRLWARSAFYQSGGAFGFRDQLQDVMALVYAAPDAARSQITASAARQFIEGDVQHWWHMPTGAGVRTRITDDLLWLPFVTAQYVRVTGDTSILDETIPFLEGHVLGSEETESFFVPEVSRTQGTLLEHCRRAVTKGFALGPNGLPLIGTGDWNDGLNRVGVEGRGESVWLAWFLIHVLHDTAELVEHTGDTIAADAYRGQAAALADSVEARAWDGLWYLRAIDDDGNPLGSASSEEMKIDSLPQSWAVISGAGRPDRAATAMQAVLDNLVGGHHELVLLFTPPLDKTPEDPGYIKGYVPGVRENGGQYTHGSLWAPLAMARSGNGDEAVKLLNMMSPIEHGGNEAGLARYRIEPYVVAADIYALAGQEGRGGWTWYTGSAAWMYRVWLEEVLGFKKRADTLEIAPEIPSNWEEYQITYRYKTAVYEINVHNTSGTGARTRSIQLDGVVVDGPSLALADDGQKHVVQVECGRRSGVTPGRPRLVMVGGK
jgi:cyclic beta-1,2-glucan synthetase